MIHKLSLTGIPQASPLAIEVAQRGQTAAGETDSWGGPTPGVTANITLTKRSNLQVAPEGMFFAVDLEGFDTPGPVDPNAYDPQFHDVYYFWSFGDPESRFTAPVNVMEHQRNANVGCGPIAAHVYDKAGTYTVSVLVVEPSSGKTAVDTFQIGGADPDTPAIQDPNDVFPGSRTLIVDSNNTGLAASYPDALSFNDPGAAVNYCVNKPAPHRVVLADDQEFTITTHYDIRLVPAMHFVRGGGGNAPKITNIGGGGRIFLFNLYDASNVKDFVLNGLSLEGTWDQTTETGGQVAGLEARGNQGDYLLVHNCTINKCGSAYVSTAASDEIGVRIWSNSILDGNQSYPIYDEIEAPNAYLGMRIVCDVDALSGGARTGQHNDGAILRLQSCRHVVIDGCDMFCRTGWFENVLGVRTGQSTFRWNQRAIRGAKGNIQRTTFEGGNSVLSIDRMNSNNATNVQNLVIESNILVGDQGTAKHIRLAHGGVTVRNNYFFHRDIPRIPFSGLFDPAYFIETILYEDAGAQSGDVAESRAGPVKMYSNTAVSMMSAASGTAPLGFSVINKNSGVYDTRIDENNVVIAPNADPAQIGDWQFVTDVLWKPRNKGYRSAYERRLFTIPSPVPVGGSIIVPYDAGRSAADYPANPPVESHKLSVGHQLAPIVDFDVEVIFGADGMTITNNTSAPWGAEPSCLVLFCPGSPWALGPYGEPTDDVVLYRPAIGSEALGTATVPYTAAADFFGSFRPVYPSPGAFEVAD